MFISMYLFILESIGMSELILIGIVALIIFGPRKLPQMAKTFGKTMTEFRRASNEFKTTWEREASFDDKEKAAEKPANNLIEFPKTSENTISREAQRKELDVEPLTPEIRQIDPEELKEKFAFVENKEPEVKPVKIEPSKRDWL